jgi:hypothetical protein
MFDAAQAFMQRHASVISAVLVVVLFASQVFVQFAGRRLSKQLKSNAPDLWKHLAMEDFNAPSSIGGFVAAHRFIWNRNIMSCDDASVRRARWLAVSAMITSVAAATAFGAFWILGMLGYVW